MCFLGELDATVEEKGEGGEVTLSFSLHGGDIGPGDRGARRHAVAALHRVERDVDATDRDDYQTLFAREEGSVAAPTASLHFTPALCWRA